MENTVWWHSQWLQALFLPRLVVRKFHIFFFGEGVFLLYIYIFIYIFIYIYLYIYIFFWTRCRISDIKNYYKNRYVYLVFLYFFCALNFWIHNSLMTGSATMNSFRIPTNSTSPAIPRCSMYGRFTYIWPKWRGRPWNWLHSFNPQNDGLLLCTSAMGNL